MGLKRGGVRKKGNNKGKSKRADYEFPCLEPSVALARRKDAVEDVASYVNQLNHSEKVWMNQFMKEYNEASVGSEEVPTGTFHITKKDRKLCTDMNNSRNRCTYTEEQAANRLNLVGTDWDMEKIIYGYIDIEDYELLNQNDSDEDTEED